MTKPFPAEVIAHAVRRYLRYAPSFRDVEELLTERGVEVSYETVRRWVAKFGAQYAAELRRREVRAGRTWHLDEMAARVGGRIHWLWRAVDERRGRAPWTSAVDEHGQTLDVLRHEHRDTSAATRFFRRLLDTTGAVPERITTDELGSDAAALTQVPELASVAHVPRRAATTASSKPTTPPASANASCGASRPPRPPSDSSTRSAG